MKCKMYFTENESANQAEWKEAQSGHSFVVLMRRLLFCLCVAGRRVPLDG